MSSVAKAASGLNGFSDGSNGVTVTVNGPPGGPATGPHAGDPKYVEVMIVSQVSADAVHEHCSEYLSTADPSRQGSGAPKG